MESEFEEVSLSLSSLAYSGRRIDKQVNSVTRLPQKRRKTSQQTLRRMYLLGVLLSASRTKQNKHDDAQVIIIYEQIIKYLI